MTEFAQSRVRRRRRIVSSHPLPLRRYASAIAIWIALAVYTGLIHGRLPSHVFVMMLGPLNAFRKWHHPDIEFIAFFLGIIGFWLLLTALLHSSEIQLGSHLRRAAGYAWIFAWGVIGMCYLGMGH